MAEGRNEVTGRLERSWSAGLARVRWFVSASSRIKGRGRLKRTGGRATLSAADADGRTPELKNGVL